MTSSEFVMQDHSVTRPILALTVERGPQEKYNGPLTASLTRFALPRSIETGTQHVIQSTMFWGLCDPCCQNVRESARVYHEVIEPSRLRVRSAQTKQLGEPPGNVRRCLRALRKEAAETKENLRETRKAARKQLILGSPP